MATYPGQQPVLQFPSNPAENQEFVGDNGVTYLWAGDRWTSALALEQKKTRYIIDGQYAESSMDIILDGNGA